VSTDGLNPKVLEKLEQMRAFIVKKAPYWRAAIKGFVYVPVPGIGTTALTRGLCFLFDPEYVLKQKLSVLAFDGAHEVMHGKLKHFVRGDRLERMNQLRWNYAGDEAINQMLLDADWDVADDALLPERQGLPKHLSAEEYYNLLHEREKKQAQNGAGGPGGPNKQEAGSPEPSPTGPSKGQPQADQDGTGSGPSKTKGSPSNQGSGEGDGGQPMPQAKCGRGACGGAAGNPIDPELEAKIDAEFGRSEVDRGRIFKQVARDIQNFAKGRGNLPGFLSEWAKTSLEPSVIRWEDELADLLHNCTGVVRSGAEDYSLRRPSKHSYMRGILRPGLVEYTPEFAFVLDTSGSMGKTQLQTGVREAAAILLALNVDEVWFAQVDTSVAMEFKRVPLSFFLGDLEFKGRGGTDFRPAFEAIEKLGPKPDIAVYFTDGDGPAPAAKPAELEVVWCIVPSYYDRVPAPWGHPLVMRNKVPKP
jgi:predicted metal-dependent peptidase